MEKLKGKILPIIPLRGITIFPHTNINFDVGRFISLNALKAIEGQQEKQGIVISQRDAQQIDICHTDLFEVGTLIEIKQTIKIPGDAMRITAKGLKRVVVQHFMDKGSHFEAEVDEMALEHSDEASEQAYVRALLNAFELYQRTVDNFARELVAMLREGEELEKTVDILSGRVDLNTKENQMLLEEPNLIARSELLLRYMQREIELKRLENNIQNKVRMAIEKGQKEYYLREQLRVIRDELGDGEGQEKEAAEWLEKLEHLSIGEEERKKIEKEIKRFSSLPIGSHETPSIRTWIETVLEMPWGQYSQDTFDLEHARKILDQEHYGLEKVKERILEHLAVCKLRGTTKGTILCLVGPPGVGKTSVAASLAKALDRQFVRMSLGGIHDESDIRGHRRTYIGAMPGRILNAMKQAGKLNPVILFDEIDKMGADYRGDPASAMLEVLDSEQNYTFRDHYLEMPFDLSKAMFITTANTLSTIPRPLLDRMEIVELPSYTLEEKIEIAERHLLPKQMKEHAIPEKSIRISREVMADLIQGYTREAGVRGLERALAELCRKAALQIVEEGRKHITMTNAALKRMLGIPRYEHERLKNSGEVGVVNGLAWTSVGGELLSVEAILLKGSGRLHLTGQLGDVMRESAQAAFAYITANAFQWGIDVDKLSKIDLHIHIPEGAIPKDGPSAGVTMATAMVSALTGIPARADVAMTGEITLRGRVLMIGGLKEKCIAAEREGIRTVIVPQQNKPHISEVPDYITQNLKFVYAKTIDDVIEKALKKIPKCVPSQPLFPLYQETHNVEGIHS